MTTLGELRAFIESLSAHPDSMCVFGYDTVGEWAYVSMFLSEPGTENPTPGMDEKLRRYGRRRVAR